MLECLDNFIGIDRGCVSSTLPPPKSGLYITDLEGISLNMAAHIVNGEDVTGVNMLRKKIALAAELAIDDLNYYLSSNFKMNLTLDYATAGQFTSQFIPPADLQRGIVIHRRLNNLLKIRIDRIKFLSNTTKSNLPITIFDGINQTIYNIDVVAGVPYVLDLSNYEPITNIVYITAPNIDIEVNHVHLYNVNNMNTYHSNCGCGCNTQSKKDHNKKFYIRGWDGTNEYHYSFGMTVETTLMCNYDSFICALVPNFRFIMLYKAGIEVAKEWFHSERLNEFTTLKLENVNFLITKWQEEYDRKYKTLVQMIPEMVKSVKDDCVICKGGAYYYQI